jgi:uncharacterized protein YgiM (DUF1202 family)
MPARNARNAQNRMRWATGMQMMASAACVGTIALAGLAFRFLQAPVSKTARLSPPENVSVPRQVAAAVQLLERPVSEQRSVAAEPSITTEGRTVQAQVPAGSTSHSGEPARADEVPLPEERIATPASPPNPAALPTTAQANNAPLRPNDTHREIVAVERSGVNIRSAPSASSRVVGSAPKGARFEVTNRNGYWLEIESDGVKGWISGHFVGPAERR